MELYLIYYSHTGHTQTEIEKSVKEMRSLGHKVKCIALETIALFKLGSDVAEIKGIPDISAYHQIILGSLIHGGRLSAPMRRFMNEYSSLLAHPWLLLSPIFSEKSGGQYKPSRRRAIAPWKKVGNIWEQWMSSGSMVRKKAVKQAVETLIQLSNHIG